MVFILVSPLTFANVFGLLRGGGISTYEFTVYGIQIETEHGKSKMQCVSWNGDTVKSKV